MTIAEVAAAIAAARALGQKVYGCKLNPQDLLDCVRELPTITNPAINACLAVTNGVRFFLVSGSRCLPRPAVTVGTVVVVSVPSELES